MKLKARYNLALYPTSEKGVTVSVAAGDIFDIDDKSAERLINIGAAEAVSLPVEAPAIKALAKSKTEA